MGIFDRLFGPPSEDKFARIMAGALRRAGDDRKFTYDKAEFRLLHTKDGKAAGVTNLRNLYTEYCKTPRRARRTMLATVCKGLLNPMEMPDDFHDVKPDLLPTVRTRSMLEVLRLDAELAGNEPMELPSLPLTDHLVICLVYDLPTSMRFVTQENLSKWGVTIDEAVEVARQNLEERPFTMISLDDKLFVVESGDAYDGTRVLMTDHIRRLELAGQPVAMPITRDCLLLTGSANIAGLNLMLSIADTKTNDARPLCPIPMILSDSGWETWCLPRNHSHYFKFAELEMRHIAGEYSDQKALLEKRNEQQNEDVFVASFSVVRRENRLLSYGVWSRTVPTWLPKTDYVALYDPDLKQQHMVAWERLQEVVGDMLRPLESYPPRYFVSDFPTEAQIAEMEAEDWTSN